MREVKVGEQVWWYYPPTANQKLKYPWTGPFEVTDVAKDRNTARISWVHASSLKSVIKTQDGKLL